METERIQHLVMYDQKRGLWTCRNEGCTYQILPARLDKIFNRSVSIESGHTMWIDEEKK